MMPLMLKRLTRFVWLLVCVHCLAGCKPATPGASQGGGGGPAGPFLSLMNSGKNYLDQGDASNAVVLFSKAVVLVPNDPDVRLNLANAFLLDGKASESLGEAEQVLKLEPDLAAGHFVKGSALLRLGNFIEAAKSFENTRRIDPGETATLFQLGMARMGLQQWDAAATAFREGIAMDPNHLHTAAHFQMAQALLRAGRQDEAQRALQKHEGNAEAGGAVSAATFERSKFTQARVPFKLEQPEREGVKMRFVDATRDVFGVAAQTYTGPIGLIDLNHKGYNSLFVTLKGQGFRLLENTNGTFHPSPSVPLLPGLAGAHYAKVLVGDLQNDRFEDVIVLGELGSHVFAFGTNGLVSDLSSSSGLAQLRAVDGTLMDLDFTGKLDLLAVAASGGGVQAFRQFGPLRFSNITTNTGIPPLLAAAQSIEMEEWTRDENMDVIVGRAGLAPLLLEKQRGGKLVPREKTNWVAGVRFATGDFDNDLRSDMVIWGDGKLTLCLNGGERREIAATGEAAVRQVVAVDYDNDGWLDVCAVGDTIRLWRNLGLAGFQEQTSELGLSAAGIGPASEIHFADFDRDCDSDMVVVLLNGGIRYLRNEGGNANSQIKVQFFGSRSNASGLGCKVEVRTGGLRVLRTVQKLPLEMGVGKYQKLDSFLVHWFNWPQGSAEVGFNCHDPIFASELSIQEGSCPYLYAWNGERFEFVTDILGGAPLGLPVAEGRYIESKPEELVWVGTESSFRPRDGSYQVQITEELREVLYLDEAKLVVVDHELGTEVHSTDKLLPGKPFSPSALITLHNEHPLQLATRLDGLEVTESLRGVDGRRASPPKLRIPQLRGLAEEHGYILDFGPLDVGRPLVLVMNGWLRFGGGMANMAASHDPSLPFPFPSLEAETAPGVWKTVDTQMGAPAGKTKTILVDLEAKLPAGARRLRLKQAFEIHWDRIALMEKKRDAHTSIQFIPPTAADLHFRGFSSMKVLPDGWPLTPDYDAVGPTSYWTIIPGGWCTRYGEVAELIATRDEGLLLLNAGDELSLRFDAGALPGLVAGRVREFFLYVDGWDKDSDFHVATGTQVEPLPFHGLNDQLYGREVRPSFPSDALNAKYNTRWVDGRVFRPVAKRAAAAPTMLPGM